MASSVLFPSTESCNAAMAIEAFVPFSRRRNLLAPPYSIEQR